AVIDVEPSRTPLTRPVLETVARVVSLEVHWNVTPVEMGVPPAMAVAVSWRVPARTTVESPETTTAVITGGPPPSPPPQATANAAPSTTRLKGFMTATPRKRTP